MWYHLYLWWGWPVISHTGSQPCLCDQTPIKTLHTKAQVSFPGWQYSMCIAIHCCLENLVLSMTPLGDDNCRLAWGTLLVFAPRVSSLGWFDLCPITVINHNHEYSHFQWFLWVIIANYQSEGSLEDYLNGVRSKMVLGIPDICSWCQKWLQSWGQSFPELDNSPKWDILLSLKIFLVTFWLHSFTNMTVLMAVPKYSRFFLLDMW